MQRSLRIRRLTATLVSAGVLALASSAGIAADMKVTLSGDQEVPPVKTSASGTGMLTLNADKSLSGSVMTKGINGSAAHIHQGAKGQNGPVAIPLTRSGDGNWTVPAGTKLTDEQAASLQAGNMYVNVHSAAHPDGEIRAQITR